MITPGRISLIRFPQTDTSRGKLRPTLLLKKLPGDFDDWLMCMVTSSLHQSLPDFDEVLDEDAPDFGQSGLKKPSVIRISRLAVANQTLLLGSIGTISEERLARILRNLADWISG